MNELLITIQKDGKSLFDIRTNGMLTVRELSAEIQKRDKNVKGLSTIAKVSNKMMVISDDDQLISSGISNGDVLNFLN
jgi:uncharacterized ubiquitin-like protein YukD